MRLVSDRQDAWIFRQYFHNRPCDNTFPYADMEEDRWLGHDRCTRGGCPPGCEIVTANLVARWGFTGMNPPYGHQIEKWMEKAFPPSQCAPSVIERPMGSADTAESI